METIFGKFSGKTISGLLVTALVILFQAFGVNIHDLSSDISVAISNFANATVGLVSVGFAIWGHIQLARKHAALNDALLQSIEGGKPAIQSTATPKRSPLLPIFFATIGGLGLCGPMTGCSTTQQQEFVTTAENFGTNAQAYAETLSNMIQTLSADATKDAPAIEALAQSWGLLPSNSSQLATFNKIVTDVGIAGTSAATLNTLLTNISTTGTVPVVATTAAPSTTFYSASHIQGLCVVGRMRPVLKSPSIAADTAMEGTGAVYSF